MGWGAAFCIETPAPMTLPLFPIGTMIDSSHRGNAYIADITYPAHFFRETMPVWITSVLTALGRKIPDPTRPYTWLELGCGTGLGATVAAAANPLGHFIGIDLNADAITQAGRTAQDAGIVNLDLHCLSFAEALPDPAVQALACDFIVIHGVYSWISQDERATLQRLVAQRLKPGGVLCIAYLSHPGSASFACARKLMRHIAQTQAGSSADKARAGMMFLQRMAQAGAGFFQDHPNVLPAEPVMDAGQAALFAHEYLNDFRDVLHVADVMRDFATADCEYAGSAAPYENIDTASLPGGTIALLEELRRAGADAAVLETFKDLVRSQTQRCDLYQRRQPGGNLLSTSDHQAAVLAQHACLLPEAPTASIGNRGTLTLRSRIGPVQLPMERVAPVLKALCDGPRRVAELAALPAYAQEPGFLNPLLQLLLWAGWLQFLRPDYTSADRSHDTVRRLNAVLARQPAPFNGAILAAAAIGSAVPVSDRQTADLHGFPWLAAGM